MKLKELITAIRMTKPSNDVREHIQLITDPAYQGAYYASKQDHDESKCWEPCGELGKSMEHAQVVPELSQTLISKLASLVEYCEMERRGLLSQGASSIRDRLLDDPEVTAWAHQHRNDKMYSMRIPR